MNATASGTNTLYLPNPLYNGSFGYFQSVKAFATLSLPCVINSYPAAKLFFSTFLRMSIGCVFKQFRIIFLNYRIHWQVNDTLLPSGVPVSYQSSDNSVTLVFTPTDSKPIVPGKYQCVAELVATWKIKTDPVILIPIGSRFNFPKIRTSRFCFKFRRFFPIVCK